MNFYPLEDQIVHLLGRNGPLGHQLFDAGFKGIHILKRVGALDNLQIRVLRPNSFDKFLCKWANLYQA
jgi:hypothetical protein